MLKKKKGQSLVEYVLILSLVLVIASVAFFQFSGTWLTFLQNLLNAFSKGAS